MGHQKGWGGKSLALAIALALVLAACWNDWIPPW